MYVRIKFTPETNDQNLNIVACHFKVLFYSGSFITNLNTVNMYNETKLLLTCFAIFTFSKI